MDIKKFLQPKYLLIGGIAVVGGLFLAAKFRPKSGGSSEPETVVATPILQPYGVANEIETQRYDTAPLPTGGKGDTGMVTAPPKQPPKPTVPAPKPPEPTKGIPGYPGPKPTVPAPKAPEPKPAPIPGTPRREIPAPTPGPPPATDNVPGGYNLDCRGVVHHTHAANAIQVYDDKRRAGLGDRMARDIATQTAIQGVANMPGLGLTSIAVYVQNHGNWAIMNRTRRNLGLKAMSNDAFKQLEDWLNYNTALNKGKSLSHAQLNELWAKFFTPYMCG